MPSLDARQPAAQSRGAYLGTAGGTARDADEKVASPVPATESGCSARASGTAAAVPRNVTPPGRSATSLSAILPRTIAAVDTPDVIPITDFRRDAARIIGAQIAAERPVFITQGGYVTAVVLSPEWFRDLVRRAGQSRAAAGRLAAGEGRGGAGEGRGTTPAVRSEVESRPGRWTDFVDDETSEMVLGAGWEFE
jgi:hypothetical protein